MANPGEANESFDNDGEVQGNSGSVVHYGSGNSVHSSGRGLARFGEIIKGLTPERKTTKADGQPAKRRGPKPDSKPALTRRQELNRQAQRTHRERKEMYIKALEQEVLRLKDIYGDVCNERDMYANENRKIRDILAAQGLSHILDNLAVMTVREPSSSGSISGSYQPASSTSGRSPRPLLQIGNGGPSTGTGAPRTEPEPRVDYQQLGVDFVLALEQPCMSHLPMLCRVAHKEPAVDEDVHITGHALMATCPPNRVVEEYGQVDFPHRMPELRPGDLHKLLDLSCRLPLDGEFTPIMAWAYFGTHPRGASLTVADIAILKADLLNKVRCYGFGAVLEEFEVRDALERVLANKM